MHLSDYMAAKNLDDKGFAKLIRRSRPTVSRIRRKKVRPDWQTVKRIEAATSGDVTAHDFTHIKITRNTTNTR